MRMNMKWLPALLLSILLMSCATSTIINLTPTHQPRNPNGAYPVEMALESSQQTLRHESLTPYVVVGFDFYKMRTTLGMTNRWEALIPIPAGKDSINYHFKVDYLYNRMGEAGKGSRLSQEYRLAIGEAPAGAAK